MAFGRPGTEKRAGRTLGRGVVGLLLPPAPPRRRRATGASLSGFVYMSSLSSLKGSEAEPLLPSGGQCCPMEEANGGRGANGSREAVPRAPSKLGCAGGWAGEAAILDGRGRA